MRYILCAFLVACGSDTSSPDDSGTNGSDSPSGSDGSMNGNDSGTNKDSGSGSDAGNDSGMMPKDKPIFVIPMENKSSAMIYGNMTSAPYINGTLLPAYAHTTMFGDELPSLNSEPH